MPPRQSAAQVNAVHTAHHLALLSEYTHALDALPLDLTRDFADLRELDAVLSSSMSTIIGKIEDLTWKIEHDEGTEEERLGALVQIATEAGRLKPGNDDKIRVAGWAVDNLKTHAAHLSRLLDNIPSVDSTLWTRKTFYPHITPHEYPPPGSEQSRRNGRRGAGAGTLLAAAAPVTAPSPAQNRRKRANQDDDMDVVGPSRGNKSPRKDKATDAYGSRRGPGGARRKNDRAASPAESLLSVIEHTPNHAQARPANNHHASSSRNVDASNGGKRRGGANRTRTPMDSGGGGVYAYDERRSRSKDLFNGRPSSSAAHPSLPQPYSNGRGHASAHLTTAEWSSGQLEGPGMPVVRGSSHPQLTQTITNITSSGSNFVTSVETVVEEAVDGDNDDNTLYCFCNRPSFGNMIACDDENCEREWFHLECVQLSSNPEGNWYCPACKAKARGGRRGGRGGKRRAGGARSGGRAT